ncbi:hypothetical protein BH10PSE19_BH10PSE19_09640 [soil metagenome]
MKLQLYTYKCKNCDNTFEAAELPGEPYGEFLLRSNDDVTYLMALDSNEFKEFFQILESLPQLKGLDRMEYAKIMHKIFGVACDLALDGTMYQITNSPRCPHCKSHNMASWMPSNPPALVDEEVKMVTYKHWDKLSYDEKKELINNALKMLQNVNSMQ